MEQNELNVRSFLLEEQKLELERLKFDADQRFFRKHFPVIVTLIIAIATIVVSYFQFKIIKAQKDIEINISSQRNERDYNISVANFITRNKTHILAKDRVEFKLVCRVIDLTFEPNIRTGIFDKIIPLATEQSQENAQIASEFKNNAFEEAKTKIILFYYAKNIGELYDKTRNYLRNEEKFNIAEESNKPYSWLQPSSTVIYYIEQNKAVAEELANRLGTKTKSKFLVFKGSIIPQVKGKENEYIFIHHIGT